jgi:aryl-alcohol dehydrogenase-like predicted oxidoreductase
MKYKPYSNSSVAASRLGFGGWQLGNKEFWGDMSFEAGVKLVKEAIEKGINFFDTAPGYAKGMSEKIIGEAIKGVREKVIINTKIGHKADGTSDFSVESLEGQIRDSLSRLNTNYIDSVLLHNPSIDILSGKTEHFKELKRLKDLGIIKAYGVSVDTYQELKTTIEKTDSQVIEVLFNVFFQGPSSLFMFLKMRKISLIAKVPLDSGWLTGKYNQQSKFTGIRSRWSKETIIRRSELIEKMKLITNDDDLTKYSLGFVLSHNEVTTVIPGIKNSEQLDSNIEAESFELTYQIKQKFIELYNQRVKNNLLDW